MMGNSAKNLFVLAIAVYNMPQSLLTLLLLLSFINVGIIKVHVHRGP